MAGNAGMSGNSVEDVGEEVAEAGPAPVPAILSVTERDDHFLVTDATGTFPVLKAGLKPDTIAFLQGKADTFERLAQEWLTPQGVVTDRDPTPEERAAVEAKLPKGTVVDRDITPEEKARVDAQLAAQPVTLAAAAQLPPGAPTPARGPVGAIPSFADGGVVDAGTWQAPFVPLNYTPVNPGAPVAPFGAPIQPPALPQMSTPSFPQSETTVLQDLFAVPAAMAGAAGRYLQENTPADSPGGRILAKVGLAPPPGGEFDPVTGHRLPPPPSDPTGSQTHPPGGLARPPEEQPPAPRVPSYGGSGQVAEFNRGIEEQRAALQAQADVEAAKAQASLEAQTAYTAKLQAAQVDYEEQRALVQRRADDLFMAIQNGKVDPNRVWANADLGQRVGAGIGILLSGIGVGLAGGPNLALQQIDRTIERDIAAQKDSLDRQQNLLSFYLQQGRDMMTAHQLVKADLKDALAAQLGVVSAQFGGAEASARAQMAMGQLRTDAANTRQQMMARDFAMKQQRLAQEMEIERSRVLSALLSTPRTPAGGLPAPGQVLEMLPKELRERAVKLPDGSFGFGVDQKRAQDYTAASQTAAEVTRVLTRYRELLGKGHPVWPSGLGGDRRAAQGMRTDLLMKMKELYKLGALQAYELAEMEKLIPDITEVFTSDKAMNQGLDQMEQSIRDKVASNLQTMILR